MTAYAKVSRTTDTPRIEFPEQYNAAVEFIDKHIQQGRADTLALIDSHGSYRYGELAQRVNRAGNMLRQLGLEMEQRVALCLLDTVDFPTLFWGAMKAGAVAVPLNTLLTSDDYAFMLRDSRAKVLVVSAALYEKFAPVIEQQPFLQQVIVAGGEIPGTRCLDTLLAQASPVLEPAPTSPDDVGFWLYTSGSTGKPKGAVHLHRDLIYTAEYYGSGVLGLRADDLIFSAAKLFFAYGLGNAMTFPLYVGASAVLLAERPAPAAVMQILQEHQPTVFFGVPTLYAGMLADPANCRDTGSPRLRLCASAGEPLPVETARRWEERFGVPILDGIGSTEMLHIFLSNTPADYRYGTTGKPIPGYGLRVVDEQGEPVAPGEIGELLVDGLSAAVTYWNRREKSRATFQGRWTCTGDKYSVDEDGYYTYCGRSDDMLKVSGHWVSPFDVESALIAHPQVLEAAVVGQADEHKLIKPKALVVLQDADLASTALAEELQNFVKQRLAPYKYPRWIEFVDGLPKTATGKIQRFKLR